MLWKMRINLADRPGSLSVVARCCGDAGVNIVGMQVFPGLGSVTDELVVDTPDGWELADLRALAAEAGADLVDAHRCRDEVLLDQATRHVEAARTILDDPARFPEVVAELLDAEPEPIDGTTADSLDLLVGDVVVQVHRAAPFTATEHARGATIAALVSDVLRRDASYAARVSPDGPGAPTVTPELVSDTHEVSVVVGSVVVGRAALGETTVDGARPLVLEIDSSWRRRGLGTRLLREAARLSAALGDAELGLVTTADNRAVLPLVLGSGLRGRIRLSGAELHVRVPVRDFTPTRG
ncbi:GNAT family N-acetyltransferase [Nocardioides sp.]|uniref:GNAT family N-acetyltransferase n=1 Tax=Nocardioides sp. TaxID=35761 RepID=UPI002630685D|nr:GNAT family N-acetyltransferase [Nocardioides sp.]MCW2736151.1 Acetyltransferase family protein [Nocardioides sp.]